MSEEELKALFYEVYSPSYIEYLSTKSTIDVDLVEILWLGFCNGVACGVKINKCNDIQ